MIKNKVKIGIIGGSGFCEFPEMKNIIKLDITTKYGKPSDKIIIGEYAGYEIFFLPRHSHNHFLSPDRIPYKANMMAFKKLGVDYIIAFCAAGSLNVKFKPGEFVVLDQFVDLTWGRNIIDKKDKSFIHLSPGVPYCEFLRKLVYKEALKIGLKIHKKGTVAVIQGPRFNTMAESKWFIRQGWDIVNMTQYPECYFAQELGIKYVSVAMITDYDIGLKKYGNTMSLEDIEKTTKIFKENIIRAKMLIKPVIKKIITQNKSDIKEVNYLPYYQKLKL